MRAVSSFFSECMRRSRAKIKEDLHRPVLANLDSPGTYYCFIFYPFEIILEFKMTVRLAMHLWVILCLFAYAAPTARAAVPGNKDARAKALSEAPPPDLTGVGITEKLGAQIRLDVPLKDEAGKTILLGDFFKGHRPVILSFGYYECPMLCGLVFNGLTQGFQKLDMEAGKQFEWVNVSIDHREDPELARKKKESFITAANIPAGNVGWHFLTGEESAIAALAASVGYGYRYDANEKEYLHGAGVYVITPEGKVSRILYGIEYAPRDLRLALVEAGEGKVGNIIDRIVLFCYQYNPHTRKYSLVAMRLMQTGGAGTILVFGGYMLVFWRRQIRRKDSGKGTSPHVG